MAKTTTAAAPAKSTKAPKGGKPAEKAAGNGKATKPAPKPEKVAGVSVHADLPQREPKWNARRQAFVKALRQLKATGEATARTAAEIQAKMVKLGAPEVGPSKEYPNGRLDWVKIIGDVYRTSELVHNGFVATCRHEGDRELRYYLTKKGVTTTFPQTESKE